MPKSQGRKTARLTVAVTVPELKAIQYVAAVKGVDEGPYAHRLIVGPTMREYRRLTSLLPKRGAR